MKSLEIPSAIDRDTAAIIEMLTTGKPIPTKIRDPSGLKLARSLPSYAKSSGKWRSPPTSFANRVTNEGNPSGAAAETIDSLHANCQNTRMDTLQQFGVSPEAMAEMEAAVGRLMSGVRDLEREKTARARMDRLREEIYRREGLLDIGGPAIRELRDE